MRDALAEALNGPPTDDDFDDLRNAYVIEDICAALSIPTSTPLANLVALTPGQHVVDPHVVTPDDHPQLIIELTADPVDYQHAYRPWTVVRVGQ